MKYLALSASNVPRGLYCHVKLCKLRQCVINRKDSRYDPHFVCVLRVSSERIVDVLGNLLDRPPTYIVERAHPLALTKNTNTYHYGYS